MNVPLQTAPLLPLVITPRPDSRESAVGYTLRLTETNGYTSPSVFLPAISEVGVRGAHAHALSQVAALDPPTAQRLEVRSQGHSHVLMGHQVSSQDVNFHHHKICPICIAVDGIYDASWHLRVVKYCPIHRIRLIGTCGSCGKGLGILRPGPGRCRCGAVVIVQDTERSACTQAVTDLLQTVRHRLFDDPSLASCPEPLRVFEEVGLPSLLALIYRLRKFVQGQWRPDTRRVVHQEEDRALEVVAEALQCWHQGIAVVQSILTGIPSSKATRGFPWYFEGTPFLTRMPDLDFVGAAIARGADDGGPVGRSRSDLDWLAHEGEWIDRDAAVGLTPCDGQRVSQLISMKLVRRRMKMDGRRPCHVVYREEIAALRPSASWGLDTEAAARITGMQSPLFMRLARSPIYQVRHVASAGGPFAAEDVDVFAAKLRQLSDLALPKFPGTTLGRVLQSKAANQLNYSGAIVRAVQMAESTPVGDQAGELMS